MFQSTRPVWAATALLRHRLTTQWFQSTRPVWAATLQDYANCSRVCSFNPRGPCGPRRHAKDVYTKLKAFQSTRPVWAATKLPGMIAIDGAVSIHAARVGRDVSLMLRGPLILFQSTRPVWAATQDVFAGLTYLWFQSTRPVWAATRGRCSPSE